MRVRVDLRADALYLDLTDRAVEASEEVADGIVVDYDAEGRIVGVEILDPFEEDWGLRGTSAVQL